MHFPLSSKGIEGINGFGYTFYETGPSFWRYGTRNDFWAENGFYIPYALRCGTGNDSWVENGFYKVFGWLDLNSGKLNDLNGPPAVLGFAKELFLKRSSKRYARLLLSDRPYSLRRG